MGDALEDWLAHGVDGLSARSQFGRSLQGVIYPDVQCSCEGVQVGRHKLTMGALAPCPQVIAWTHFI